MADRPPLNICGAHVRYFRNAHQWSQEELAAKCQVAGWDISRAIVANIEGLTRKVSDRELKTLAAVLAVPIAELVA